MQLLYEYVYIIVFVFLFALGRYAAFQVMGDLVVHGADPPDALCALLDSLRHPSPLSDPGGNGNGNGTGNGSPEDPSGGDSSYVSNVSRAELLVRMGLLRAQLGGGRVAGDRGLRPIAESLWRDVEELGRSGAVANRIAGE